MHFIHNLNNKHDTVYPPPLYIALYPCYRIMNGIISWAQEKTMRMIFAWNDNFLLEYIGNLYMPFYWITSITILLGTIWTCNLKHIGNMWKSHFTFNIISCVILPSTYFFVHFMKNTTIIYFVPCPNYCVAQCCTSKLALNKTLPYKDVIFANKKSCQYILTVCLLY